MATMIRNSSSTSSNNYRKDTIQERSMVKVTASCYAVDASSMALKGFHYSTTGAGGKWRLSPFHTSPCISAFDRQMLTVTYRGGVGLLRSARFVNVTRCSVPAVLVKEWQQDILTCNPQGIPSPPLSPPLSAITSGDGASPPRRLSKARGGGAAYTITGECERLFCETLRAVFLGEGNLALQDSLVAGVRNHNASNKIIHDIGLGNRRAGSDRGGTPAPDGFVERRGIVRHWLEVWDYTEGVRFRGFVAGDGEDRALFVFFDNGVIAGDLKPGLMALLEMCSIPDFGCSQLVVCLDREVDSHATKALMHDLGWVGFELITLAPWVKGLPVVSKKWLLLGVDV